MGKSYIKHWILQLMVVGHCGQTFLIATQVVATASKFERETAATQILNMEEEIAREKT